MTYLSIYFLQKSQDTPYYYILFKRIYATYFGHIYLQMQDSYEIVPFQSHELQ